MAAVMVFTATACGEEAPAPVQVTATPTPSPTEAPATPTPTNTPKPTPVPAIEGGEASITFEDGNFGFVAITQPTIGSDNSKVTIEEINGSKVLAINNTYGKKEAYVGIDLDAMLGDRVGDVTEIKFDIGTLGGDSFSPISGNLYTYTGEGAGTKTKEGAWSVYLENKNPKTVSYELESRFTVGEHNYIIISKEDDVNGKLGMWIDNIKLIDLQGNLVPCDTTVLVAADSPLAGSDEVKEVAYGRDCKLNLEYQGDWSTGVGIPAAYFENVQGPVSVVLDTLVLNPSDWAGIFATDAGWVKPTADYFVDIDGTGNGVIHFQDDGALIFDDLGASQISFTITKEAAAKYAANGGMFFPGYNLQVLSARVSDTTFKSVNNLEYQGDWTTGVGIPAAFFENADGPVSVRLDVLVLNPSDWAGIFATDAGWVKPVAEDFADITGAGNGVIHFQDDGALIFDDLGATQITFTITKEAAAKYAANGGMFFPGYNCQVLSAMVCHDTFFSTNNLEYQGDWTTGVGIPAAFFADADRAVSVSLEVLVLNPSDWAGIFATDAGWVKPVAEDFVDITSAGNGVIHFQDDGALIFDDLGATTITFTITKEAAAKYAANGGMFFPGYNCQVLSAVVNK